MISLFYDGASGHFLTARYPYLVYISFSSNRVAKVSVAGFSGAVPVFLDVVSHNMLQKGDVCPFRLQRYTIYKYKANILQIFFTDVHEKVSLWGVRGC